MKAQAFGVMVGRKAVVGFRQLSYKERPGTGDNVVRDGEKRASSQLIAVLGKRSPLQYKWTSKDAAKHIAGLVGGKVVKVEAVP